MAITAATGSSRRSTAGGSVNRSYSQSGGRFSLSSYQSPYSSSASTGFASSSSSFATRSSTFFAGNPVRSASPPRVSMSGHSMSASAVRFSLDRSVSPNRSISTVSPSRSRPQVVRKQPGPKKTCMCSPTTHPGSFRCSLHKNQNTAHASSYAPNNRLNARRSAMTNSLVRIGGVEGDLVRRALAALIRPSSHQQRRRAAFQPRPSRLSSMSKSTEES
ncbi:unnamed protein product [Linum tenue]|uniref:Serine-rich protein-like protein n=2 Tax=Linum TaxID=4005 RepID=A0AAV0HUJ7_9ROSI|nr:unnamed protein product [Linum tenue]CAI0388856.1 unnamed protein product [Linum tenue]